MRKAQIVKELTLPLITAMILVMGTANTFAAENDTANPSLLETEEATSITSADDEGIESGTCGDNLTWTLDGNGTLTISGTGKIDDRVFYNNSDIVSVIIEDGVTSIGEYTFGWCENLISVTLANGITSIGSYAFYNCDSLVNIEIPDSVTTICEYAFGWCESLTSIVIPDSVTSLGDDTFFNCESLTNVVIPDSITKIGEYTFYSCSSLTCIEIPDSVTAIGSYAFAYCRNLNSATISNNVTSISNSVFIGCTKLTNVTIPNSIISIARYAFSSCKSLTDVYYCGSKSDWNAISIASDNTYLTDATIHYNYDPTLTIDFSTCTISLSTTNYTYDGTAKTPTVTVKNTNDNVIGSGNYTVSYSNNVNAGTAVVIVTGIGNCTGTATKNFTIAPIDISIYSATLSCASYTFSGESYIPIVTIKDTSENTIDNWNYTVSYNNNKNAGTATVTITGTDNYTGTITKNFTINKASQSIDVGRTSLSIKAGNTTTISADGIGAITYSSSDTSIATVDSNGNVTGKGVGTATITIKAAGNGNYNSTTKTVSITVGLSTPSIYSVKQSGSSVNIKWETVSGANGYYIYRSTSSNGKYSKIKTITNGKTINYKDTSSKTSGKTYYYKIYAYSGNTTSSASSALSIKYMKGAVSSLTNTSKGITVKWSKVNGANGYYIYRKTSNGKYTKVNTITSASTTNWTDTSVKSKNGTTYTYYVQPYNSASKGAYSTKKTVRLTAVSISSLKNTSSKKMTVKWSKNSKATGYQIQYSTSSSFSSYKSVTISGASSVKKTFSSLTKKKTYYVRIRAYKTISGTKYYSAWSNKKSVKISK